jgi:hypothetical protein
VTPCPNCFSALDEFPVFRQGECLVCRSCAVILRCGDDWAITAATPPQIDALPATAFTVVLEASMRVLAKKIYRRAPVKVRN